MPGLLVEPFNDGLAGSWNDAVGLVRTAAPLQLSRPCLGHGKRRTAGMCSRHFYLSGSASIGPGALGVVVAAMGLLML